MASQYPPVRGAAFTLNFTLYKNDGTIIANPGTITKKISKDEGALADIATAIVEEDTTYGQCSVTFTATEMTADRVWYYIADDTTGCVPITGVIHTSAQLADTIDTNIDTLLSRLTATRAGYLDQLEHVADHLDTVVGYGAPPTAAVVADAVWDENKSAHGTGNTFGALLQAVPTAAQNAAGVWNALISGITTTGSIGKRILDFVTTLVYETPPTTGAIADAVLDETFYVGHMTEDTLGHFIYDMNLNVIGGSQYAHDAHDAAESALTAATAAQAAAEAAQSAAEATTPALVADAVWDEVASGHATAGTTGAALSSASPPPASEVATAVWHYVLGVEGAGTTGNALGGIEWGVSMISDTTLPSMSDTLAAISSRVDVLSTQTSVDDTKSVVDAIYGETGGTIPNAIIDAASVTDAKVDAVKAVADAILVDTGTDIPATLALVATSSEVTGVQSATDTLLKIALNKRVVSSSLQVIYEDDNTTPLVSQILSSDGASMTRDKSDLGGGV